LPELRRSLLAHLFAFLFACLGSLAVGGKASALDEQYGEVEGVVCTVAYHWPKLISKGYFPVEIRLENRGPKDVIVSLLAEQEWQEKDKVRRDLALASGESIEFELLLRDGYSTWGEYSVSFEVDGEELKIRNVGPGNSSRSVHERALLYVSAEAVDAGSEEAWTQEWKEYHNRMSLAASATNVHTGAAQVSPRTFDQLSTTWQAYTSLDTVILDVSGGWRDTEPMNALLAWCRSGGKLMLAGLDKERLRSVPGLESSFEERLRLHSEMAEFNEQGLQAYRHGFGALIVQEEVDSDRDLMDPGSAAMIADMTLFAPSWTRPSYSHLPSRERNGFMGMGKFSNLPFRSLMLLIIVFAILIGPVNFIWIKRTNKPMLLLISVPAIALVSSLILVLYGVLSQGLDVKSISKSWALLDQRDGWSTTAELRRVFAGSAPGEGLRPEARTLVYPEDSAWRGRRRSGKLFTLDLNDGRLYGGDYFPVREPFGQILVTDRSTRLRLEVLESDEGVTVTNALGSRVEQLILRAVNGDYFFLGGPLGEGASSELAPGGSRAIRMEWQDDLHLIWGEETNDLLPGSYIALLQDASLGDDCGVEVNEIEGRHVLAGILDTSTGARQ
jgi:hypothetical protein